MLNKKSFASGDDARAFFRGYGDFGEICGELERKNQTIVLNQDRYRIECRYTCDENGVFSRKDCFQNISDEAMHVNCLKSRFVFDGGEYRVYTQFNVWQHESCGGWQPLISSVSVGSNSSRLNMGGTPFLVLWNEQTRRGVAFHLITNSAWEMKVTKAGFKSKYTHVVVDLGISDYNLDLKLEPGEEVEMPEILCYEIRDELDMDCWKLHRYMHRNYPRKAMPMLYNTWLCRFDHINYEVLAEQAELAAELGLEYFVVDAGWFGKGEAWNLSVGDWSENMTSAMCGKMGELADKIRALGMKFGLWLEPERAVATADSVRDHGNYYIKGNVTDFYFLDFANEEARQWMLDVIFRLIDCYGIEYIKDDYNADLYFDPSHTAFLKYHEGHRKFMQDIRDRYPNIYLTNCAAGGMRLDLGSYIKFDSAWPSDNENPYDEMRIYRDTIVRMPPQGLERWIAVHSLDGYQSFYENFKESNAENCERIVACGDGVWHHVVGVQRSYLNGYMTCGPVGFSCDLRLLSKAAKAHFKEQVAQIKAEREFWRSAEARILSETKSITVYQYNDMMMDKIVVQVFTRDTMQNSFRVFPLVDEMRSYRTADGMILTGREIAEDGFRLTTELWQDNWYEMLQLILEAI